MSGDPLVEVLHDTLAESNLMPDLRKFAQELIEGIYNQFDPIDSAIEACLKDWTLDRLANIDRNILRIATYELLFLPGIPPSVSINEAIEIGKKYSTEDSGKFINGVLGGVLKNSAKANWDPATAPQNEVEDSQEEVPEEEEVEVEEIDVNPEEAEKIARVGGWTLRKDTEV